ncbi:MAG: DUF262 domain-containing protein [Bacillota bacterium]
MAIEKYKIDKVTYKELNESAALPRFQRRLVWSEKQKKEFIDNLKYGYPFGSILIYKYENKDAYSIIDGLQRYSTMKDYKENPYKYVRDIDDYIDQLVKVVLADNPDSDSLYKSYFKIMKDCVNEAFRLVNSSGNKTSNLLFDIIERRVPSTPGTIDFLKKISKIEDSLFHHVENYLDIDEVSIPAIIFNGDESELAVVFENLNRGGKKLTKYQVFAAQWSELELELNENEYNKSILNCVIERYITLQKNRDLDIIDFDEEEMRKSRKINLSEFCYALGYLIVEKMDVFWSEKNLENEDIANEIGFSTLGIVLSVDNTKLHQIINKKEFFSDPSFVEKLVSGILEEYQLINNVFTKYLKIPGDEMKFESKVATNFQVMSYFAALWTTKYSVDITTNKLTVIERYKRDYNKIKRNLIFYYINDAISSKWSGTGDKHLNDIYIRKSIRYKISIEKTKLENNLFEWLDDNIAKASLNFDNNSKMIFTIYTSFYMNELNSDKYDLEHLIARKKLSAHYRNFNMPAGNLGNLLYMDLSYNRSKKEKNLYDSLKPGQELNERYLEIMEYPNKTKLETIEEEIESKIYSSVRNIIETRAKAVINNLLNNLYSSSG